MKSLVISLTSAKIRRRTLEIAFQEKGIEFSYIDAIDATTLNQNMISELILPERRDWKNYLRPGAVCCALSHLKAYSRMIELELDACAIFEDDAVPLVNEDSLLTIFDSFRASDFDILLLGSYAANLSERALLHTPQKSGLEGHDSFLMGKKPLSGAIAYLIKKRAAERLCSFNRPVRCTADEFSEFISEVGLHIAVVKPDLVIPFGMESSIDYLSRGQRLLRLLLPEIVLRRRRLKRQQAALNAYDVVSK